MNFTSLEYLVALAVAASVYRFCPIRWRAAFLLCASYLFYLTYSPKAAILLAFVTLAAYSSGRLPPSRAKTGISITVIGLAGLLAFFKFALATPGHLGGIIMPLGISYYTFKLISYVLDVHWGKIPPERRLIPFAAYIAFFPQIVAGPIQRPGDFFDQMPPRSQQIGSGIARIALGFAKKLLIADNLGVSVNYVYGHVTALSGLPMWAAFYLFPLQLYADFSGLTDIAIGSGLLFGIRGPENFNRPFTATSISDYWRRWHMSLTSWLGDYVFTPLRMASRNYGNGGLAFSITVNMVAIGLWHGLSWGYLVFGLTHSIYLIADALTARRRARYFKKNPEMNRSASWTGWVLTFHLVCISLVFFRARHIGDAVWLFSHLGFQPSSLSPLLTKTFELPFRIGLVGYALLEVAERFRPDERLRQFLPSAPLWTRWAYYCTAMVLLCFGLLLLLAHGGGPRNPFLYEVF